MIPEPTLQYASSNEDSQSELDALLLEGRRVLSIAAAGERAFALLLGNPREVVAIDQNPAQIYLGELKATAMRALTRDEYLRFVGLREDEQRELTYRALEEGLSPSARRFWRDHVDDIRDGVLEAGRTERGLSHVAPLLRAVLSDTVEKLRAAESIEAQGHLARTLMARPAVHAVLALIFNPISGRFVLRDKVYYGDARRDAPAYLSERIVTTLENHRFDDCFIFRLFLDGHLKHSHALPIALGEEEYSRIRERLDRLRFEVGDVRSYLAAQPDESFDAFSLSDLGGYLDVDEYTALLDQVERVAAPGATVCIREFISQPTRLAAWPPALVRDQPMEERLDRSDRSVGCTFVCASKAARENRA